MTTVDNDQLYGKIYSIMNAVIVFTGGLISIFLGSKVVEILTTPPHPIDKSLISSFAAFFGTIFLFQIGFVDNFYLRLFSLFTYYCLNEVWVPLYYSTLQNFLMGGDKIYKDENINDNQNHNDEKRVSSGSAIFRIFETLSASVSPVIVGSLIDAGRNKNIFHIQISIFPLIMASNIIAAICFYKLGKLRELI